MSFNDHIKGHLLIFLLKNQKRAVENGLLSLTNHFPGYYKD
jgi:hypothetical protein